MDDIGKGMAIAIIAGWYLGWLIALAWMVFTLL